MFINQFPSVFADLFHVSSAEWFFAKIHSNNTGPNTIKRTIRTTISTLPKMSHALSVRVHYEVVFKIRNIELQRMMGTVF